MSEIIDALFQKNVKEEYAVWDYFSIQDSEVIIHYHYWTHTDGKITPKYNMCSMKITYGGIENMRYEDVQDYILLQDMFQARCETICGLLTPINDSYRYLNEFEISDNEVWEKVMSI